MQVINLSELTDGKVRNLAGHDRGLAARNKFRLDEIDAKNDIVKIIVPPDIYSLGSSFFQGMFASSVKASGSREKFLSRYHFDAPHVVLRQIDQGIESSLMQRGSIFS